MHSRRSWGRGVPCLVWQSIQAQASNSRKLLSAKRNHGFHPAPYLDGPWDVFFLNVFKCGQRVLSLAQLLYSAYPVQCTVLYTVDRSYPNVLKYCKQYSGRSVRQNNNVTGKDYSFYPVPGGQTYCLRIIFRRFTQDLLEEIELLTSGMLPIPQDLLQII